MASSGLMVDSECIEKYGQLNIGHTLKYIVLKANDDLTSIVYERGEAESSWDEFVNSLPSDGARYCFYSFDYTLKDGSQRDKPILISWVPDDCRLRHKMVFASSKNTVKDTVNFGGVDIMASAKGDLVASEVYDKVSRGGTS